MQNAKKEVFICMKKYYLCKDKNKKIKRYYFWVFSYLGQNPNFNQNVY